MSNNWFNFEIPVYSQQFGNDWEKFQNIVNRNQDYIIQKTWQLYWLKRIECQTQMATEYSLRLRAIDILPTDTIEVKKTKLRNFCTTYKSKGMSSIYLSYSKAVLDQDCTFFTGYTYGMTVWGQSIWPGSGSVNERDRIWSSERSKYMIYLLIPETAQEENLDILVNIYREDSLLPAFYKMFFIDRNGKTLRAV